MKIEIPNSLLVTLSGQTSRGIRAAEVRESDGHLLFTLTDGSKIDLGSVVGPTGAPGTKGDKGEPGAAGYSPAAKVQRTETGAIITITDKTGTSYASVSDGKDGSPGAKGDPGDDYVLTSADRQEIAASVVAGGLEVEVSDETPGGETDILICHISGSGTDADPYACDKTSQEINEAATAGKIVYAIDASKRAFPLVSAKPVAASFAMVLTNGNLIGYQIKSSTVTYITRTLQDAANRVTALSDDSTDAQYPSAKAVYDALQDTGGGLSLGLTGAAVGQIAKITAVDENGKPTAWSPVDMPSGGLYLLYYTEISDGNTAPYIELPITDLQRYHKISWAIFVPTFAPEVSTNIIRLKIAPAGSQWYSGVIYSFCPADESIKLSMRGEIDVCGNKVIAYCASNQKQYKMISFSGNASSLPQELDANSRIFVELYNRNVGNLPEMTIAIYGE